MDDFVRFILGGNFDGFLGGPPGGPAAAAPCIDAAAPCIAIAYQSSVANEQGSRRESRGKPSSPDRYPGYWIVRLGRTLRYHAQMVYRVCEMLRAVLKQPNLEPP